MAEVEADLKLSEIVLDWNLYPRTQISSEDVTRYAEAILAGEKLPAVIIDKKSKRLIDGFHRYKVYERLKIPEIKAIVREYPDKAAIWKDIAWENARHGRAFTTQDKRRYILKAEEDGLTREQIAGNLALTREQVDILADQVAREPGGEVVPLKHGLGHFKGRTITKKQQRLIERWGGMNVLFYVRQVTEYLEAEAYLLEDARFVAAMDNLTALWSEIRARVAS